MLQRCCQATDRPTDCSCCKSGVISAGVSQLLHPLSCAHLQPGDTTHIVRDPALRSGRKRASERASDRADKRAKLFNGRRAMP